MNSSSIFAPDFRAEPYWWDVAPPESFPSVPIAGRYDVAIVGSGFTGLRAALTLKRGGASVIVLDSQRAGEGASRRNAGFLGRVLKKSYVQLRKSNGAEYADRVYTELNAAYETTLDFVRNEKIECYAQRCGRFIAANSPAHLRALIAEMQAMKEGLGWNYEAVSSDAVSSEMGSEAYCGGVVVPDLGSIHPGLYHKGLLQLVIEDGIPIATETAVAAIAREQGRFKVITARGSMLADRVVVATNGYTPPHLRWHARRVVPFVGFMAATEELPTELLTELNPHGRTILDSHTNIDFFRLAPDSPRLLFGGSTGSPLTTTEEIGRTLHALLTRVYPQLKTVKLSAVWSGQCAGTFDMMPHIGEDRGLSYGLGYNFAGVPMGSYFGDKIAQTILGSTAAGSVFSEPNFPTLPFYSGRPWFVPMAMRYFDRKDRKLANAG